MYPIEQEKLVARIIAEMAKARDSAEAVACGSGQKNRIRGASGYHHQIDVSVRTRNELSLYECKHWGKNVGPEAILTLAGRGFDIQGADPHYRVSLNIVVNKALSTGAARLAEFFGILAHVAKSPAEFSIAYKTNRSIAVVDSLGVKETDVNINDCDGSP